MRWVVGVAEFSDAQKAISVNFFVSDEGGGS